MTPRKIKNFAISYIAEQLEKNPDWFHYITDSWIYDAESWFLKVLEKQGMKIFTNDTDCEYTEEVETIVHKFWGFVQKEKERKYEELYEKDGGYYQAKLNGMEGLLDKYGRVKLDFVYKDLCAYSSKGMYPTEYRGKYGVFNYEVAFSIIWYFPDEGTYSIFIE